MVRVALAMRLVN